MQKIKTALMIAIERTEKRIKEVDESLAVTAGATHVKTGRMKELQDQLTFLKSLENQDRITHQDAYTHGDNDSKKRVYYKSHDAMFSGPSDYFNKRFKS